MQGKIETYKGLPIYDISIDGENLNLGAYAIGIVEDPAIEVMAIKMAEEKVMKFKLQDQQVITSPLLIPNLPIIRKDEQGFYYIKYSEEVIKQIAIKYFKDNRHQSFNLSHDDSKQLKSLSIFESWIVSSENDKAYDMGFDKAEVPVGTWMISAYCENPEEWTQVKSEEFKGISIEILAYLEPVIKQHSEDKLLLSNIIKMFEDGLTDEQIINLIVQK